MIEQPDLVFGETLSIWRLERRGRADGWDSGIGASMMGGRWNSKGVPAVYCSLDPATAILEVAVHVGFRGLDSDPRVLVHAGISDTALIRIIHEASVPNRAWMRPGTVSASQQEFGDGLLRAHAFVAVPSTVSKFSWNLMISPNLARDAYAELGREDFELDGRLNPAGS